MRLDSGWNSWDMEIYGSRYVNLQIGTATEEHHGIGKLTRSAAVRASAKMSNFCEARSSCKRAAILSGLLLLHMWPFSRTAVLIPLAWWAMYAVNRWRVSIPVLGLIDEVAEKSGYYPVYPKKTEAPEPHGECEAAKESNQRNRGGIKLSRFPRESRRLLEARQSWHRLFKPCKRLQIANPSELRRAHQQFVPEFSAPRASA